eukprot:jgi/Mesen1/10469/ME000083S09978
MRVCVRACVCVWVGGQVDQLVFDELVRKHFPRLVGHLDMLGVQVTWVSGPWFLSVFVNGAFRPEVAAALEQHRSKLIRHQSMKLTKVKPYSSALEELSPQTSPMGRGPAGEGGGGGQARALALARSSSISSRKQQQLPKPAPLGRASAAAAMTAGAVKHPSALVRHKSFSAVRFAEVTASDLFDLSPQSLSPIDGSGAGGPPRSFKDGGGAPGGDSSNATLPPDAAARPPPLGRQKGFCVTPLDVGAGSSSLLADVDDDASMTPCTPAEEAEAGAGGAGPVLDRSMSSISCMSIETSTTEKTSNSDEQDEIEFLQAQVALLREQLAAAQEGQDAATIRADELQAALVALAQGDNRRMLCAQIEKLQDELDSVGMELQEKDERLAHVSLALEQLQDELGGAQEEQEAARARHLAEVEGLQREVAELHMALAEREELRKEAAHLREALAAGERRMRADMDELLKSLAGKEERLQHSVEELEAALEEKGQECTTMVEVMVRMQQEQSTTEALRVASENQATSQRQVIDMLTERNRAMQEKNQVMEKRALMAESMLQAFLEAGNGTNYSTFKEAKGSPAEPSPARFDKSRSAYHTPMATAQGLESPDRPLVRASYSMPAHQFADSPASPSEEGEGFHSIALDFSEPTPATALAGSSSQSQANEASAAHSPSVAAEPQANGHVFPFRNWGLRLSLSRRGDSPSSPSPDKAGAKDAL